MPNIGGRKDQFCFLDKIYYIALAPDVVDQIRERKHINISSNI